MFAARPEDTQLEQGRGKLRRLQRKQPAKITAKATFLGEMLKIAAGPGFADRYADPRRGKKVVSMHGRMWPGMTPAQKAMYEKRAQAVRCERLELLNEQVGVVVEEIRDRRAQALSRGDAEGVPCRFTACRLSEQELQAFDSLWTDPRFSRARLGKDREQNDQPLGPMQCAQLPKPPGCLVSAMVSEVATLRNELKGEPTSNQAGRRVPLHVVSVRDAETGCHGGLVRGCFRAR